MPRPQLPDEERKDFIIRARAQPWLYIAIKETADKHNRSVSEELTAILRTIFTSGAQ